jgi:hypothetical protein
VLAHSARWRARVVASLARCTKTESSSACRRCGGGCAEWVLLDRSYVQPLRLLLKRGLQCERRYQVSHGGPLIVGDD